MNSFEVRTGIDLSSSLRRDPGLARSAVLHDLDEDLTACSGGWLGTDRGGKGGGHVDGVHLSKDFSRFEVQSGEDDRDEGVVAPGRAMGHRHREAIKVVDEPVRLEDNVDLTGASGVVVVQYRSQQRRVG